NLQDLPTGTVRFTGNAYAGACSAVTTASVATWFSAPVLATVSTTPVFVELAMQPSGQATVGVDFGGNTCRSPGAPCLSGSECCSNVCTGNACAAACPPGTASCNGGCFDLMSDSNNCGQCGLLCPPGLTCTQGQCTPAPCAPGLVNCGSECTG